MGIPDSFFRRRPRTNIPDLHRLPVDPFYASVNVEEVALYQRYFDRIVNQVDVMNYTHWSMSHEYDRAKLDADDDRMVGILGEAQSNGISGALLQNMVNQYFFADVLQRQEDKAHWVRRVMHPQGPTEYFPPGAQMRGMMEMLAD